MLFNSFTFLIFFIVVTVLFFLLPHKIRWLLLLLASCFFYMYFKPVYILILGFTIVIDFYAGIFLEAEQNQLKKKIFLITSLAANIGVLAIFKYYNFFDHNLTVFTTLFHRNNPIPLLQIALPLGLSFHTFQAMSYTIEVYRGNHKAERHFGIYSLYVMFYPQLVAGPIERPQNMLYQFHEEKHFKYENAVDGLKLMMWGMFKKVVIADRLALIVDPVYNHPHNYSATSILFVTILFTYQLYCDFSGYTDIALGAARIMGFNLMRNFNHPFTSKTIAEYWRRWHISLSTWFNDYLFTPILINKRDWGKGALFFALFITFLISGLWHGANWTFILWGMTYAFYLIFGEITKKSRNAVVKSIGLNKINWLYTPIQQLTTFSLVVIAGIFFRANSVWDAIYIFLKIPGVFKEIGLLFQKRAPSFDIGIPFSQIMMSIGVILFLIIVQYFERNPDYTNNLSKSSRVIRWSVYYAITFAVLYLGVFDSRQFIYFQF